jgi:hypothetical protein
MIADGLWQHHSFDGHKDRLGTGLDGLPENEVNGNFLP